MIPMISLDFKTARNTADVGVMLIFNLVQSPARLLHTASACLFQTWPKAKLKEKSQEVLGRFRRIPDAVVEALRWGRQEHLQILCNCFSFLNFRPPQKVVPAAQRRFKSRQRKLT
jgi:hypothetical protein